MKKIEEVQRNQSFREFLFEKIDKYSISISYIKKEYSISSSILQSVIDGEPWFHGKKPELKFIFLFAIIFVDSIEEFSLFLDEIINIPYLASICNYSIEAYIVDVLSNIYDILCREKNVKLKLNDFREPKEFLKARFVQRINLL
ncbi:hypothetical protein [Gallibacter intestinalis]|uniref:XRE family transcriptional regulator n=1 Tax=Gallibacter intestinalis TaxID=2779356 RepID=A0ABR9QXY9_9FIRM|nr:hypothetical protein [Gallibacter intestinalis]MBE5035738.1 hypothetical protein [Gallibacter intestinalis]